MAPVNYLAMDVPVDWTAELQALIERTATSCAGDAPSFEAKTTVRQLLYVNSARWAAKALSVGESLGLRVIYPYIWRDILEEQGKLPWDLKIHNAVVKWPLKRLLEDFMPADFIYRKKSGFVPPLVHWLTNPEFNRHVQQVLFRPGGYVTEIIPARILEGLLADAAQGHRLRAPILNFLWGAFFAEAWIQANQEEHGNR
jgi:asparagine synthase (glutamine-hydrolysing)